MAGARSWHEYTADELAEDSDMRRGSSTLMSVQHNNHGF